MRKISTALALFGLLLGVAVAQDEFIPDPGQEAGAEQEIDDEQKEKEKKIKKYEEILKDAVKSEGPFTFYLKEKDVYWELDPEQLGKYWFFQATLRTGAAPFGLQAGDPVGRASQVVDAFRWERHDEEIWLHLPNLAWRWEQDDPLAIAAKRTFPEAIMDSYKIEVEHPETKKMLLKVTNLFYGGLFDLNQRITMAMGRPYQLDRGKSRVSEIIAYPENMLVRTELHYTSRSGPAGPPGLLQLLGLGGRSHLADAKSMPLSITYSIYPREESDYMPRFADPRVGYFTQDYYDHGRFMRVDRMTRLINRWNLKKKDPDAELSEPVKPIVWYIDDSVPEKYREACAEGILRWNKAFEMVGYKNAIEVKMKPEDADWDHADMRYNVLRFTTSETAGYAIALFRTDPFTGEIINAGITCDANMVYFLGQEYQMVTQPSRDSWTTSLAALTRLESAPEQADLTHAFGPGWRTATCEVARGKMESAYFGWTALETLMPDGTSINQDEYIKEFLADLVSHEAGHCFGLRHNFVATTELALKDLENMEVTGASGISASVMDYVPVNIAAVAKGKGHFYSRTVGTYDLFAIEYGYADVTGNDPIEEYSHLMHIASKNSLPGHAFMTDENADTFDPYVVRFDLGKNPLDAAELTISIAKKLLAKADQRYPKRGRPYSDLSRAVNISLSQTIRQCMAAARFVGGVQGRRNFAGDPGEKPTLAPVDPGLQRRAINLIARELLSEDAFRLSEKILMNLSSDPNRPSFSPAPIKDMIASLQMMGVSTLLSASTTDRVANNSFKWGDRPDKFTLSELYGKIAGKVFSEVGTGRTIGPLRRDLQRFTVEALIRQALARGGSVQEDVRMLAWDSLRRLRDRFAKASARDDMTAIHLRDTKMRIDRALKSIMTLDR